MSQQRDLSREQLLQFARAGVLKLEGLLDEHWVALARQAVLRPLEGQGLYQDGKWRLNERQRPKWPATGLKPARDIGRRHPEVEALIELPAVKAVAGRLLDGRDFDRKVFPRPQVLASLPNSDRWVLPTGWHTDVPRLASGRSPGFQLFMFLDSVRAQGGGTVAVAGSHHLLNDGRDLKPKDIKDALRSDPFFQGLFNPVIQDSDEHRLPVGQSGAVSLEVAELVGEPGDAWVMDLRVLHAAAPNCCERPRLMATYRFLRADLMPEITAAFAWK